MEEFLKEIFTGFFANGLRDLLKILIGGIFGWIGHSFYNKALIKGRKNIIKQKGKGNFSKVEGDENYIDQSN